MLLHLGQQRYFLKAWRTVETSAAPPAILLATSTSAIGSSSHKRASNGQLQRSSSTKRTSQPAVPRLVAPDTPLTCKSSSRVLVVDIPKINVEGVAIMKSLYLQGKKATDIKQCTDLALDDLVEQIVVRVLTLFF